MIKFKLSLKNPISILLMQAYSIGLFVLFVVFIYLPYNKVDFDLFPIDLYKVSWRAFGYYTIVYMCIWVYVQLRLNVLSALKGKINIKQLLLLDVSFSVFGIPMLFFHRLSVFGILAIEFSVLLVAIDLLWNSKKQFKLFHVTIVLFFFVNIVLLFVNWRNNISQEYKATCMVNSYLENKHWDDEEDLWALAAYKDNRLIFRRGDFDYPRYHKFNLEDYGFNKVVYRELDSHYLYLYDDVVYVVSCPAWTPIFRFMVNFTYVFTIYLVITIFLYYILSHVGVVPRLDKSFFSKLQYTLMLFMLGCMLFVLILISAYIGSKYTRMSRNAQVYRTKLFVNYIEPEFAQSDDPKELQCALDRIAVLLKSEIVMYKDNGNIFLKSSNANYLFKHNWSKQSFSYDNMEENIVTDMKRYNHELAIQSYTILFDNKDNPLYTNIFTKLDKSAFDHEISLFVILMLNMYFLVLIISIAISYFISKRISLPLTILEKKMQNVQFSGDNEKLEYKFTDDDALSNLVGQYNKLLDKLKESAEQLAQNEREESWRNMARQIAHEIKNPLTPMNLLAQQMRQMKSDNIDEYVKYVRSSCDVLLGCIDNVKSITNLMSNFANTANGTPTVIDLVDKLKEIVELFKHNDNHVEVRFDTHEKSAIIYADKDMISQAFNNLITNAIQSINSASGGCVLVELSCDNNNANVSVTDNGCGISAENISNIFKVSYTTKTKGMGIGLCVVKNVIDASHGTISVESKEDEGTTFITAFPLMNNYD